MSSITQEALPDDDVFNYVDPKYSKHLLVERQNALLLEREPVIRYEGTGEFLYLWHVTQKRVPTSDVWGPIIAKRRAKSEDLIGSSAELAALLREITNLAFEDEQDEFGPIRPTYHAFKNCMRLVLELAESGRLSKPSDITTDHNGDIRVSWARGDREAELVCPSEGPPYIYYSSKETYGVPDGDLTIDTIIERVRWAMDGK
jgi:hypothetical protein